MAPFAPDLVTALDKMMRSDLDVWSSLWFWILVGSTIAVAIGIIAEAPEVWKEVGLGRETVAHVRKWWYIRVRRIDLNGWEKVCPELIATNDSHRRWIVKAAFIGWLLVAAGVAGEGIAEYFVNDAETGIQAFDEARLAETTEQAGDAAQSAKTAHDEADAAGVVAGKAQKKASDALGTSKTANDIAESAKEKTDAVAKLADEANKKADDARMTASLMHDALTPRTAGTNGEQNDELELFAGTKAVVRFSTDAEARDLTANIMGILARAKWNILGATPDSPLLSTPVPPKVLGGAHLTLVPLASGLREGVFIIAKPGMHDPTAEEAAELLCYVLKDNQVGCDAWPMLPEGRHWPSQVPDDAIQILVGRKPMAYLKHPDNPELLKLSIESENREKTMSDQDKRDRQYILEQRRAVLRQNAPPKPN